MNQEHGLQWYKRCNDKGLKDKPRNGRPPVGRQWFYDKNEKRIRR
jgi:hypothetical protein